MSTPVAPIRTPLHTKWFLIIFYLIGFVFGLRNIWYWEPSKLDLLLPIAFALNALRWVIADASRRGHAIPMLARPIFLIFCQIAVPIYVIWSRGWRGLVWTIVIALGWVSLIYITCFAGGYLVYGDEWIRKDNSF